MPYIVIAGIVAFISTIVVFLIMKLFFRSFLEKRQGLYQGVLFGVPFAMGFATMQWMQIKDQQALKDAGFTRAQYDVLHKKFKSFLNDPLMTDLYSKIQNTGNGEIVFDGRLVLWEESKNRLDAIDHLSLQQWVRYMRDLSGELSPENCGRLYLETITAEDFFKAIAKWDEEKFDEVIGLLLKQVAIRRKTFAPKFDPKIVDEAFTALSNQLGSGLTATLRSNIELRPAKSLGAVEACEIIKNIWGSSDKLQNYQFYNLVLYSLNPKPD